MFGNTRTQRLLGTCQAEGVVVVDIISHGVNRCGLKHIKTRTNWLRRSM
jgi:hypothetical protein